MQSPNKHIAIIGGGPAGLMAAEKLSALSSSTGFSVHVYERKPSLARKLLMAGRGGLNITHSEDIEAFTQRYGTRADIIAPLLSAFSPEHMRDWCAGLGAETFIGTSGRVFPKSFKASPLLRAWIARLEGQGVVFHLNHNWLGWDDTGQLTFEHAGAQKKVRADATMLALGGTSWPRLGSDGSWVNILEEQGVEIAPLMPANCGFHVDWSTVFAQRYQGAPIKSVGLTFAGTVLRGEFVISEQGVEGSAIYALSSVLRETVMAKGGADLVLDLKPDLTQEEVTQRLSKPRAGATFTNHLRKTLKLSDVAIGLLYETLDRTRLNTYGAADLAVVIKAYR
ncbi:MAG TPA: aminoacetone oxidase family FAD-binding enzyme, partial [Rhodospirillaceae bacterium]|nr:aminoacetone oxidase family FAD-binding enzyme [Rhodospirillaceae bacterium]